MHEHGDLKYNWNRLSCYDKWCSMRGDALQQGYSGGEETLYIQVNKISPSHFKEENKSSEVLCRCVIQILWEADSEMRARSVRDLLGGKV